MIYGERIRFRAIEREDLPHFVAWLNDPEVLQGLLLYLPLSQEAEEDWYENMLKRPVNEHPMAIEVKQADGWLHIGNCGFMNIDWRYRSGEVGIFIGEKRLWYFRATSFSRGRKKCCAAISCPSAVYR